MQAEQLASSYPVLYHMAENGSWESIKEQGLLSTSALLDLYGIEGECRFAIESRWRPEMVCIEHCQYGVAFVRDQRPMPENLLLRGLEGMIPQEWYETLNRKVFFWAETDRCDRFLRAYGDEPRIILEVETRRLLERHAENVTLSRINTGAPFRGNPSPRGTDTFKRIGEFPPFESVAEVAVDCAVRDIADFTLRVSRWQGVEEIDEIWTRDS